MQIKPLQQSKFKMKIIKDLGIIKEPNNKRPRRFAIFKCNICKNNFKTSVDSAKTTTKCKSCRSINTFTKHGESKAPLYFTWKKMKQRCYNIKDKAYKYYGGRGIIICDEWLNEFETFKKWALGNGYQDNLSIDRINNDGNYEPNNCRWTIKEVQARNTRKIMATNLSGYRGVSFVNRDNIWIATISVNNKKIYIGRSKEKLECAKMYDKYVIDNNLEHTINGVISGNTGSTIN